MHISEDLKNKIIKILKDGNPLGVNNTNDLKIESLEDSKVPSIVLTLSTISSNGIRIIDKKLKRIHVMYTIFAEANYSLEIHFFYCKC